MSWSVIALAGLLVVCTLLARRLEQWGITTAMLLVPAGFLVGWTTHDALAAGLTAHTMRPVVETILAIVLFEHAANIRGGFFGGQAKMAMRLLFLAMPLSLGLAVLMGLWLVPHLGWPALLLIACVVVPIDFSPVMALLHDERIPLRVRQLLNVEEGYSDGVIAPIFLFALALTIDGGHTAKEGLVEAMSEAVPHLAIAVVLGLGLGGGLAWLANAADRADLTTERSRRVMMVITPVLTYLLNVGLGGNGFVAAFVGGVAFNSVRVYVDRPREQQLLDDTTFLLAAIMWFVFGAAAHYEFEDGVKPHSLVWFSLLVLTVARALPVLAVTVRSSLSWRERTVLATLGPRGTANISLALLAYVALPEGPDEMLLEASFLVIIGSIAVHGLLGPLLVRRTAVAGVEAERQ